MKPYLLYTDRNFNIKAALPWNAAVLTKDLGLQVLFDGMSGGDELLAEVACQVLHSSQGNDITTVTYRQEILKDCLARREAIQAFFDLSTAAIEARKDSWLGIFTTHPRSVLSASVSMMHIFTDYLRQLRTIAAAQYSNFHSKGLLRFLRMLQEALTDTYFDAVSENLSQLTLKSGLRARVHLAEANKGSGYILQYYTGKKIRWWHRFFPPKTEGYFFNIHPRDESGIRALDQISDQIVNEAAHTVAKANDHILQFFTLLRQELAFYLGCIHLYDRLKELHIPVTIPQVTPQHEISLSAEALYDPCLALSMQQKITGNDINTGRRRLIIITGANQGGKSTFMRSIGVAQLMMQSGMFVAATAYSSNLSTAVFTHFKKEEDHTMQSGKLDEELSRMNKIADHLSAGSIVLFNESFAATNEREGAEIATQIVNALIEKDIKVVFVTHLYDFAIALYKKSAPEILFLRAERLADANRNFKLREAAPLPTSYGPDLYKKIFKDAAGQKPAQTIL